MGIKQIAAILLAIGIGIINYVYGNAISTMLSITIIASLIYFVVQIGVERIIEAEIKSVENTKQNLALIARKSKRIYVSTALLLLAITAISCIWNTKRITNPSVSKPWFYNIEQNAICNKAIGFSTTLQLQTAEPDSVNPTARYTFTKSGSTINARLVDVYEPIFKKVGTVKKQDVVTPINNIYAENIANTFTLKNTLTALTVNISDENKDDASATYSVNIATTDTNLLSLIKKQTSYTGSYTIKGRLVQKYMLLYNVLCDYKEMLQENAEATIVVEALLGELEETYFIANYNTALQKSYSIFPAYACVQAGYNLGSAARITQTLSVDTNQYLYIGVNNAAQKFSFKNYNNTMALVFDAPSMHWLYGPSQPELNQKNTRFIYNKLENVVATSLPEGFWFHNCNLYGNYTINGELTYVTDKPNTPLAAEFTDRGANTKVAKLKNNAFALSTANAGVQYYFEIRDFGNNGYAFGKLLLYFLLLFVAMALLVIYKPTKKLRRLEPIILSVLLTMLGVRLLMLWRLATFPPLKNIKKSELENTLINFDYNLIGSIKLPIPLTFLLPMLALLVIFIKRSNTGFIYNKVPFFKSILHNIFTFFKNLILKISTTITKGKLPVELGFQNVKSINTTYFVFVIACMAVAILFKSVDALARLMAILLPISGYLYFSYKANNVFKPTVIPKTIKQENKVQQWLHLLVHYFYYNPTFYLTVFTLLYLAKVDRGFGVLFLLFVLFKNILLNFLKPTFDAKTNKEAIRFLYAPQKFWIIAILCMLVFGTLLSWKAMFYYTLIYKFWVIGFVLVAIAGSIFLLTGKSKLFKLASTLSLVYIVLMLVAPIRTALDTAITNQIKHTQFRASIIHQPISKMLAAQKYSSFNTDKIIATAESQWFINTYITKPYEKSTGFNLQPFTKVGVDYSTQTRDVVVARFVIGELGNLTMALLLIILALPLLLYLVSYKLKETFIINKNGHDVSSNRIHIDSYNGLLPLILLFIIALFVWLTSTNRFVFFGQDFPFLSLTSKVSLLFPIILLCITILQKPQTYAASDIDLRMSPIKFGIPLLLAAILGAFTAIRNDLATTNFTATVPESKDIIEGPLDYLLQETQDSLKASNIKYNYTQLIQALTARADYKTLLNSKVKDPYTASILEQLQLHPSSATKVNNPLYIIYDRERYRSVYNTHLYLQLPPAENRVVWNGTIHESSNNIGSGTVLLKVNRTTKELVPPCCIIDNDNAVDICMLPASWLVNANNTLAILNVNNRLGQATSLELFRNQNHTLSQSATMFNTCMQPSDICYVNSSTKQLEISFNNSANVFATNKWVNNNFKNIFKQDMGNMWLYHFTKSVQSAYSVDSTLVKDVPISLDYNLAATVQGAINVTHGTKAARDKEFAFSVIAADGDGNIRLMQDINGKRKKINPNNDWQIAALQQKHFFYSNVANEKAQWSNGNLTHMRYGPGSSIKPVVAALVTSQVNAGWDNLQYTVPSGAVNNYAGLKLAKPWENADIGDGLSGQVNWVNYLAKSSNYYHSLMLFLGSYSKSAFAGGTGGYNLKNILSTTAGTNNNFPVLSLGDGNTYYLPNYNKGKENKWPSSDAVQVNKSYFANTNSILANALETNVNLPTKDKNKLDGTPYSTSRTNFTDSFLYTMLQKNKSNSFMWGFPEESYFLQQQRHFISNKKNNEIQENFNVGLKNVTLGGYPYLLSPYKMLEMYMAMFTFNRAYQLHIINKPLQNIPWQVDSSWAGTSYKTFMANNIFKGMAECLTSGTAKQLADARSSNPSLFFYAKTGTIGEGTGINSRRLIVTISNKDMTLPESIGSSKIYSFYFAVDHNGDFSWPLLNQIIKATINTNSFKQYMNTPNE